VEEAKEEVDIYPTKDARNSGIHEYNGNVNYTRCTGECIVIQKLQASRRHDHIPKCKCGKLAMYRPSNQIYTQSYKLRPNIRYLEEKEDELFYE